MITSRDPGAEPVEVVFGGVGVHHLDAAAGDPKEEHEHRVAPDPVHELVELGEDERGRPERLPELRVEAVVDALTHPRVLRGLCLFQRVVQLWF